VMSEKHTIAHVIMGFVADESMSQTIMETARRIPAFHHLITATALDDPPPQFARVHQLTSRSMPLGKLLQQVNPRVIHLHIATYDELRWLDRQLRPSQDQRVRTIATIYAWPRLRLPTARFQLLRVLRRLGITELLTTDPQTRDRLDQRLGTTWLPGGTGGDPRRAQFTTRQPLILCSGPADRELGVNTLLSAFPLVRDQVPDVRLRLLLQPRPGLPGILQAAQSASLNATRQASGSGIRLHATAAEPIETVVAARHPGLGAEMAAAQVGVWPYRHDYATLPPVLAVAQAASVGLPGVGTDVICVRTALEAGVTGLLVPPDDPGALARCITRLLVDEVLWYRYARAGPAHAAARLSWDLTAQVTAAAYWNG
jgi:alpha-maltose-1-phosphate synthase